VVVARELTKAFETFHRGTLGADLTPPFFDKGECVVIVEAEKPKPSSVLDRQEELIELVHKLIAEKKSAKDIAREASDALGLRKSDVYDVVMEMMRDGSE
jgi:16S rRNA C1402 (ribose-2'-O) methylase RsmI